MSDCPCKKCPSRAICINKYFFNMINECPILEKHMVERYSGSTLYLNEERFYELCEVMEMTSSMESKRIIVSQERVKK